MRIYIAALLLGILGYFGVSYAHAQTLAQTNIAYSRARVSGLGELKTETILGQQQFVRDIEAVVTSGPNKNATTTIRFEGGLAQDKTQTPQLGQTIIVSYDGEQYAFEDFYRLPQVVLLVGIFFTLAILLGKRKGLGAIIGLIASATILITYLMPRLIAGAAPLPTILTSSALIAIVSILLAHGFEKRTYLALISTITTLALAGLFAHLAIRYTQLFGLGSETAFYLQINSFGKLDLRGLLLGGIIIGALGILDDITTAQTAVVDELQKANPALSRKELYRRGLSVGREHIASLVNTLFLAYAGSSLSLLLLLKANIATRPLWTVLSSEFMVEEIVRTLIGSIALILAVPISTAIAAYLLKKE